MMVHVSRSGGSSTYHSRRNCQYLPDDADRIREVERDTVEPFKTPCERCMGDLIDVQSQPSGGGRDVYMAAKRHGDGDG